MKWYFKYSFGNIYEIKIRFPAIFITNREEKKKKNERNGNT